PPHTTPKTTSCRPTCAGCYSGSAATSTGPRRAPATTRRSETAGLTGATARTGCPTLEVGLNLGEQALPQLAFAFGALEGPHLVTADVPLADEHLGLSGDSAVARVG